MRTVPFVWWSLGAKNTYACSIADMVYFCSENTGACSVVYSVEFHAECIDRWVVDFRAQCPICKQDIEEEFDLF